LLQAQLQEHLFGEHDAEVGSHSSRKTAISQLWTKTLRDNADAERNSWTWAWALDDEHPPPTSIVSRRDTAEARNLARVADLCVGQEESRLSGNMLWSVLVNFLTAHPSRKQEAEMEDDHDEDGSDDPMSRSNDKAVKSMPSQMFRRLLSPGGKPPRGGE
jgi:hypothetical protein